MWKQIIDFENQRFLNLMCFLCSWAILFKTIGLAQLNIAQICLISQYVLPQPGYDQFPDLYGILWYLCLEKEKGRNRLVPAQLV
jgi:hypothetical protein